MSPLELVIFLPILAALAILLGAPARNTSLAAALRQSAHHRRHCRSLRRHEPRRLPVRASSARASCSRIRQSRLRRRRRRPEPVMLLLTALVTLAAVWVTPPVEKARVLSTPALLISRRRARARSLARSLLLLRLPRTRAHPDLPAHRHCWGTAIRRRDAPRGKSPIYLGARQHHPARRPRRARLPRIPKAPRTFDLIELARAKGSQHPRRRAGAGSSSSCSSASASSISLFPFHTWAAPAYATAPTPVAMLHAGVLKKFGLYGLHPRRRCRCCREGAQALGERAAAHPARRQHPLHRPRHHRAEERST